MDTTTLTFAGLIAAVIAALIQFIFRMVEKSLENQRQITIKAEIIAELLAEWEEDTDDRRQLNTLVFQAFLWLPDDIAKELFLLLSYNHQAKSVDKIVIAVREHLIGKTGLTHSEIVYFNKKQPSPYNKMRETSTRPACNSSNI